jgi:indoleamine 2,3-dioxygenase
MILLLNTESHIVAEDFDIDSKTGFVPSVVPISRLPIQWAAWECVLDELKGNRLQLGDKPNLSAEEIAKSEAWRARVREVRCHSNRPPLNIILMQLF